METLGDLSNWAARRLARSLLKRYLQQILATDLDFEQISVQLAKGSLELKACLLDTKYLNEQLVNDIYEIESGLVGKISISLFDLRIVVEDVTVNVRQREVEQNEPDNLHFRARQPGFDASQPIYTENEGEEPASTAVAEGIGLVSNLVQKLFKVHVEGRRIGVEMKLAQGQLLTVILDNIAIKDAQGVENGLNTACDVAKACSFAGLAVKLTASDDPTAEVLASISWETSGCSGTIAAGWLVDDLTLDALASFDGVCVWMQPAAASVISNLVETYSRARAKPEPFKDMPPSDHLLTRSMMVADAATQSNVLRALTLPDGESLLEEELARMPGAQGGEEDVDEFFDALASYSVTDYMSQSFFSTASTVFGEVRDRPLSLNSESLLPLEDNSTQFAANEMPPSIQIQVEVIALELWLACRSKLIGSEDPWYMRLNMRGTSLRQDFSSTWTASVKSIDISEYTPIEANKSKLHDIGQFEALYEKFATHCDLPSFSIYFSEERAFADTIRRLEHLKLADRNFWRPPDNYEMSPIIACAAAARSALSLTVKMPPGLPCALSASLLLLEVHSCLNAPMLTRIEELLASFAAGFSLRTTSVEQEQQAVSLDLTVHLSTLTLCFFAPNAAIALQVLSGVTIDELSSLFNQRGSRWNQSVCPPFIEVQRELDDTVCRVYAKKAQIHNMLIDTGGLIEIVDGGYAEAFNISCVLNVCLNLQTLSEKLPEIIAALIDESKRHPFVDDTTGMGKTVSIAGPTVKTTEVTIAGEFQLKVSPILVRSVIEIASSFSVLSRPPNNSGAFKLHIAGLKVQFLGPLSLVCRDIRLMHIMDDRNSSFAIGSIGSFCLHGGSEWPYISTFDSEAMAIAFAISDSCESQAAIKKRLILCMNGIILAEDVFCEQPAWREFDYMKSIAIQSPSNATAQSLAVHVLGKQLLILQIPSSQHLQIAAGVHVQDFCIAAPEPAAFCVDVNGASIYLRETRPAYTGLQSVVSVPKWLQETGFLFIAREEKIHLKRWFSTIRLLKSEIISLRTLSLHLSIGKDSTALIKKLLQLPLVRRRHAGEASEDIVEMAADAVEEALGLDIGGPDEQHAPLNGAWYAVQGPGVEERKQPLGTDELRSFPTKEATVNGDGAWLLPYVYAPEMIPNPVEIPSRWSKSDTVFVKMITIGIETINLIVIGTASGPGGDLLEGSLQVKVENSEAAWRQDDSVNILHDCKFSIQRLSMRHDIHSQATPSSPWHDFLICPHLRGQLNAFDCQVEIIKSQSLRNELVLRASCSPGSALIQLDQYLLLFSQDFIDSINHDSWQTIEKEEEIGREEDDMPAESGGSVYIQRCHIAGFALTVSYTPAYVDMGAIRKGSYIELLNVLRKLKAFNLWLQDLEICGAESLSSLGAVAATRWMKDILTFQKHRFSISLPGGQSVPIGAIGRTLTDFAAQPATQSKETFEQLQRAAIAFLHLMANEGRAVSDGGAGSLKK